MITQQTQIKINLPLALKEFLESRAQRFGLPIATYVKQLILQDVKDLEYPVFEPSISTEKAYKKGIKDYRAGNTIPVDDLDKFFKDL